MGPPEPSWAWWGMVGVGSQVQNGLFGQRSGCCPVQTPKPGGGSPPTSPAALLSWRRWRGHWGRGHRCDPPPRPRLRPRRCPVSRALSSAPSLSPGSCRRAAVEPRPGAAPVPEALLSLVLARGHLVPPCGQQGRVCFPGPQALGQCSRFSGPGGVGREGQGAGLPRIRLAVAAPRP